MKKILDVFGFSYYKAKGDMIKKVCNFDDFDFSKTPFPKVQLIPKTEFNTFCSKWGIEIKSPPKKKKFILNKRLAARHITTATVGIKRLTEYA
jgi:hypothetical protein